MKFNGLEKNRQTSQTRELKSKSVKRPKIPIPNKKIVRWCSEESDFVTIMDGLQQIEYSKQCYVNPLVLYQYGRVISTLDGHYVSIINYFICFI